MTTPFVDYKDGITTIDAQFIAPGIASIHMIEQKGRIAFIDTGTAHSLSGVREVMRVKDISADRVAYVIVTHVHLDHAGGAGGIGG